MNLLILLTASDVIIGIILNQKDASCMRCILTNLINKCVIWMILNRFFALLKHILVLHIVVARRKGCILVNFLRRLINTLVIAWQIAWSFEHYTICSVNILINLFDQSCVAIGVQGLHHKFTTLGTRLVGALLSSWPFSLLASLHVWVCVASSNPILQGASIAHAAIDLVRQGFIQCTETALRVPRVAGWDLTDTAAWAVLLNGKVSVMWITKHWLVNEGINFTRILLKRDVFVVVLTFDR